MYNVCFCFRISIEGELPFAPTIYQKAIDNQYNQLLLLLFQFFRYCFLFLIKLCLHLLP